MIVVPRGNESLSGICSQLPDGYYGLPRFELPEWLWEDLPRANPAYVLDELGHLGPGLALDEPTLSHEEIRFDAPGDFQLVLRDDFFAIDGFDEQMVHGWHVDSNLSKRMLHFRGSIESVESRLVGYHCNHNRTPTTYHTSPDVNDLGRFFFDLEEIEVPRQRQTWGLADVPLEEVWIASAGSRLKAAIEAATEEARVRRPFDARGTKFALEYDSTHVLPFVADAVRVSPRGAQVAYVGTNVTLERMLATLVDELGFPPLHSVAPEDVSLSSLPEQTPELFVIDLGVDASLFGEPLAYREGTDAALARARLFAAFETCERLIERERRQLHAGAHPNRYVLVNSTAVLWKAVLDSQLHCGATTAHSRVRHAIVRDQPDRSDAARSAERRARQLATWLRRQDAKSGVRLKLQVGRGIRFAELESYGGFGRGWGFPDSDGVWTRGPRADLGVEFDNPADASVLTLEIDGIDVAAGASLRVALMANGSLLADREFSRGAASDTKKHQRPHFRTKVRAWATVLGLTRLRAARWSYRQWLRVRGVRVESTARRIPLPRHELSNGVLDLTFVVGSPGVAADRRGLHVCGLGVARVRYQRLLKMAHGPVRSARPSSRAEA